MNNQFSLSYMKLAMVSVWEAVQCTVSCANWLWCYVWCTICYIYCSLFAVHCSLYPLHSALCIVKYPLFNGNVHCLIDVHRAICHKHCCVCFTKPQCIENNEFQMVCKKRELPLRNKNFINFSSVHFVVHQALQKQIIFLHR